MPPARRLAHNGPPVPRATASAGWRLYELDRNTRWHLVDDVPTATSVVPLLEAVDDPGARSTDSFPILLTLRTLGSGLISRITSYPHDVAASRAKTQGT